MKTPLQRIRTGALILVAVFIIAVVGYRFIGKDYDWVDAVWMVVVTISSVGYGEQSRQGHTFQLFSVAVIVFGISALAYTFGGIIQMMTEGEIQRALGLRRMARDIDRLEGHTIICGFGRVGQVISEAFHEQGRSFVVVDSDAGQIAEADVLGYLYLNGDAAEEETLLAAGVERAKTVVTTLPNDAANVFITLTSRDLSPTIQIIARAEHPSTQKKLRQAGADKIVMPTIIGARQMVRMVTRPSTADLIELMYERSYLDVELDEITIVEASKLVGVTVRETEAHRKHRLLVVAVKQSDDKMVFNPDADYDFRPHDVVIIMGHEEDIKRFSDEYELS